MAEVVACHICGAQPMAFIRGFERLPRVTSDCHPWPEGGRLAVCRGCGSVQHPVDEQWQAEAAAIYQRYDVYHQAGGDEQKTFGADGAVGPRSARLVRHLRESGMLRMAGRVLDYGCGNGAFLRAFAAEAPGWTLAGADIGENHRRPVEAIGGAGYVNLTDCPEPGGQFDLITMSHCLEHLEHPLSLLVRMRSWLAERGQLLIQVPHVLESPFDLVVADHCTHFTTETLGELLDAAGFDVAHLGTAVVAKEITAVASPAPRQPRALTAVGSRETLPTEAFAATAVTWLQAVADSRDRLAGEGRSGIFGTSIAGIWLYGGARQAVKFFVDEDPSRVGRQIDGIPIVHPAHVPSDASVLLAMPCTLAAQLYKRLGSGPGRYHLPPPWPEAHI
jgi:SAM-dependent methyltransferase